MQIKLYNTTTRSIQEFIPIVKKEVGIYTCGPTVYNYAHIGNLRTYIFEDLLKRAFFTLGYKVNHVMNITDVGHLTDDGDDGEDKMEKSSREKNQTPLELAKFYTDAFFNDTDRLNIIKPNVCCPATEHIQDMIDLIKRLEDRGFTYIAGGNVYFSIDKFPQYGKMANLDKQELKAGARIIVDENKKNPHDFVLWFTKSKFENHSMLWDSPWGVGYPGWHIECSAMSMKYLGETFDIHCGGIDHIPVHHTNEIAQSEAATGKEWVHYWVHGEFLILDKGKMSKSSGTFLTLQALVDNGYDPLDYRYFCLCGHYRSQLKFTFESLDSAKSARQKLNNKILSLKKLVKDESQICSCSVSEKYEDEFFEDIYNDLNLPKGLATMWAVLKDNSLSPEVILSTIYKFDEILGLNLDSIEDEKTQSTSNLSEAEINDYIEKRASAKKEKNFAEADKIRNFLLENGVAIKDTPNGVEVTYLK